MTEWISILDQKPPLHKLIVIYDSNKEEGNRCFVAVTFEYFGGFKYQINGAMASVREITHWMPLPELPKEKE